MLLGGLLIWQVAARSLAAYLADAVPETAIFLHRGDSAAQLRLAERSLAETNDREKLRAAQGRAEWALLNDPLSARATGILGQVAEILEPDRALLFMTVAARRSLRESSAIYRLMAESYKAGDFATAAYYLDILMRTTDEAVPALTPILAGMAEQPDGRIQVRKLIFRNPPWREKFFSNLPANVSNPQIPLDLLVSLKETTYPGTAAEWQPYLDFLVQRGYFDIAYYAWLQFLGPEQPGHMGLLFNGDFAFPPSGLPFDWKISSGRGVTAEIAEPEYYGDKPALRIEFGHGRVEFPAIKQLILLPRGAYRLNGFYKGQIGGRRGLRWGVYCAAGTAEPLGLSSMIVGQANQWTQFDFAFTVDDCGAQYVMLSLDARSLSEQMVSGSIRFSGLSIELHARTAGPR